MSGLSERTHLYREGSLGSATLPYGDDTGTVCFNAPSTHIIEGPGGRLYGPKPEDAWLLKHNVRLINYDRPGYGDSEPNPGRRPVDTAADVERLAAHFGSFADGCGLIGKSGGGPHAAACAVELSGVGRLALLGSPAPRRPEQIVEGFGQANAQDHQAIGAQRLDPSLRIRAIRRRPENHLYKIWKDLRPDDHTVLSQVVPDLLRTYTEAVCSGKQGWTDDYLGLYDDWGFDFAQFLSKKRPL